ncbi:MAG: hypothetical protein INR62_06715 [Rhodospirillales bacterium]|nr:hypothetical protein [Acetobacter sp.]
MRERLQSLYDPEAHYSTERQTEWSGYKVHVTETCDGCHPSADTCHEDLANARRRYVAFCDMYAGDSYWKKPSERG